MFFGISCRHVCPELTSTAAEEPGQHMRGVRAELCVGPGGAQTTAQSVLMSHTVSEAARSSVPLNG